MIWLISNITWFMQPAKGPPIWLAYHLWEISKLSLLNLSTLWCEEQPHLCTPFLDVYLDTNKCFVCSHVKHWLFPLWICVWEESKSFSSSVDIIMCFRFMLVSSNLQSNSLAMQGCSCCLTSVCLPLTLEFLYRIFLAMDNIDDLDDIFGTQEDVTCTATTDGEMDGDEHPLVTRIGTPPSPCDRRERATCVSCGKASAKCYQHVINPKPWGPIWINIEMLVLIGQKRIEWHDKQHSCIRLLAKFVYGTTPWSKFWMGARMLWDFRIEIFNK